MLILASPKHSVCTKVNSFMSSRMKSSDSCYLYLQIFSLAFINAVNVDKSSN